MPAALVTIRIGEVPEFQISKPIFEAYAMRHGLDLVVLSERKIRHRPRLFQKRYSIQMEKFQIHDVLADYERVIFVDADCLILPECPNLLDVVPEGSFGGVYEDVGPQSWKRQDEIARVQERLGDIGWEEGYFNSGVMVLSQAHRELFAFDKRQLARGRWPEQTTLNYRLAATGLPLEVLAPVFNYTPVFGEDWTKRDHRLSSKIVHYAGEPAKAFMQEDFVNVASRWQIESTLT